MEPILFAVENGGGLHRGDSLLVHLQGHGIGAAVSLPIAGQFFASWILLPVWITLLFRLDHKGWAKKVSEARAAEHLEA